MTERKDFKRIVRDRANRTGESYSSALRNVRNARTAESAATWPAGSHQGETLLPSTSTSLSGTSTAPAGASFASRFASVRASIGPLVWGLDPHGRLLESWGVGDTPDGLDRFVDIVVGAAVGVVGIVKPQSAFYERHGWRGMRSLARLVGEARSAGLLVIIDAKRGDVGSTNDAYAEAFLGPGAPFEADALTVHPYLGVAAMGEFVKRAHESGSCVLVLTRSSNPEGTRLQSSTDASGLAVDAAVLDEVARLNAELAPEAIGPLGAVIGPTLSTRSLELRAANALFLAPGLGAQGATATDVAQVFATCPDRVMPSASRSLLEAGPDQFRLRDTAEALQTEVLYALR